MANLDINQYTSKIWNTANLLIGAGIKQSEFPKLMMPFFALVLLESRIIQKMKESLKEDFDTEEISTLNEIQKADFIQEFKKQRGYNELVVKEGTTLRDIVHNEPSFHEDFDAYLNGFDALTQNILGITPTEEIKGLDINGAKSTLRNKEILLSTVKEWALIDLTPLFENLAITTLEEHIKYKWADISAATSGEQYTPRDIIQLMTDIVSKRIQLDTSEMITVYDPTCGGGSLLFGTADELEKQGYCIKTYGQEWNDTLYALSWIEMLVRKDSEIYYGNTLTDTKIQQSQKFHIIVANPPHGISWKGFQSDVEKDQTQRFAFYPSNTDSQLLFAQHILHHVHEKGIALVVHNGSALFSGDAGSGESNIRKHFFDNDWVEAIIQLPQDEFYNTNIHTYLWIFNKNKPDTQKNKVMLIDSKNLHSTLKKTLGKKRKEIREEDRKKIVDILQNFSDEEDFVQIFDKDYFYYNKQTIQLTNVDINGKSIKDQLTKNKKSISIKATKITFSNQVWDEAYLVQDNAATEQATIVKEQISSIDCQDRTLRIETKDGTYYYDSEKMTIILESGGQKAELGHGIIKIKHKYTKKSKTKASKLIITVDLIPDYEKDYEKTPYSRVAETNIKLIDSFLKKYITKPYVKLDCKVGTKINFNEVFYKPKPLRSLIDIKADIASLEAELDSLENELNL